MKIQLRHEIWEEEHKKEGLSSMQLALNMVMVTSIVSTGYILIVGGGWIKWGLMTANLVILLVSGVQMMTIKKYLEKEAEKDAKKEV